MQCDLEGSAPEHQRKGRHNQKQDNPLRIDPWSRLELVFGGHYEITKDSASSAVIAIRVTMITSSNFLTAGFMTKAGA
jgi:hypothetical protein